jgi:hypothetical protein
MGNRRRNTNSPTLWEDQQEALPKKRKKPIMLTGRSRKFLEQNGFIVALVERSLDVPKFKGNPNGERFRNKFDAFGIADLAAVHPDKIGTLWVQVTDHAHRAEHVDKILQAEHSEVLLKSKNGIELHCWKSSKTRGQKRWCLRLQKACLSLEAQGWEVAFLEVEEHWFRENMQEIDDF